MSENGANTEIINESGTFEVGPDGRLVSFSAGPDNTLEKGGYLPGGFRLSVRHLRIPEGVRVIGAGRSRAGAEDFRSALILEDVVFPESCVLLEDGAFNGCCIGRLVLPESLKKIGCGCFIHCLIRQLVIRKEILRREDFGPEEPALTASAGSLLYFGGRCFKESVVGEAVAVGKEFSECVPGARVYGVNRGIPENRALSVERWMKRLMPEADAVRIRAEDPG